MEFPPELFSDTPDKKEQATRVAKWLVMQELRVPFETDTILRIACNQMPGYGFVGAMRKTFAGRFGNAEGLSLADIEVTADYLGVYDILWPVPSAGSSNGN